MNNIIDVTKTQIENKTKEALKTAIEKGIFQDFEISGIFIEIPKEKGHGEFSTNVAMQLAKKIGKPTRVIADEIIGNFNAGDTYIDKIECAGPGFINFYLNKKWLYDALLLISELKENYGKIDLGQGKKVMVEFVSANPTGPLTMGNARGGALGDCLASVLSAAGYDVTREFYINDTGNQIVNFGKSLEARYIQEIKGEGAIIFPEDGYHGDDIKIHAREYIEEHGTGLLEEESEKRRETLIKYALDKNLKNIKEALEYYGIDFDVWFSEKSLYDSGAVDGLMKYLTDNGYTAEKDGAIWLRADAAGLEKDEVLVKSNDFYTYLVPDIAYHRNKFFDRGFDRVINLLGADHHGHAGRMKNVMKNIFGIGPDRFEIILYQLVRLYQDGQIARMSKRTGRSISLTDLLDEVGRDAARFFFNLKTSGTHLDFDLDLAVSQSNDNPVFYVQYAHARICSMISLLEKEGYKILSAKEVKLELLTAGEEEELIAKLAELPEEIKTAAIILEPSRLTRYLIDVAGSFHSFYNACRIKGEDKDLAEARMFLISMVKIVIGNVLELLSISAPEKM